MLPAASAVIPSAALVAGGGGSAGSGMKASTPGCACRALVKWIAQTGTGAARRHAPAVPATAAIGLGGGPLAARPILRTVVIARIGGESPLAAQPLNYPRTDSS